MKNKVMTHVVAGYPSEKDCIELLLGMQAVGVSMVEVQIPFSDPMADGSLIMQANDVALKNGMTVLKSFDIIKTAQTQGLAIPLCIMSYANKLFGFGIKEFCIQAKTCGAKGFIIPDLPVDTLEYKQLAAYSKELNLDIVPVLSLGMADKRLALYNLQAGKLVYVISLKGTTGLELKVSSELRQLTDTLHTDFKCKIALGFGIRTNQHIQQTLEIADIAVVGSAIIETLLKSGVKGALTYVKALVEPVEKGNL